MKLPKTENLQNIIWIQTSFLGDIVLSTAAMRLAQNCFPGINQILITTGIGAKALAAEPYINKKLVFAKRSGHPLTAMKDIRNALRAAGCHVQNSVVLTPHRSLRSALLSKFLHLPSIGYREGAGSFLYTTRCARIAVLHECHRIGLLLEPLGVTREQILASRPTLQPAVGRYAKLPDKAKIVAVAPGSKWGTKMWPEENFSSLIDCITATTDLRVVLLGSEEEARLNQSVLARCQPQSKQKVIDLTGATSLDDLRGIYPHLQALVSNDSSPMHYASAFNIPTVAIFGATVAAMGFGPLATRQAVVAVDNLPCRPCSDHGPPSCPLGHFQCMRNISVQQVWQALQSTY